MTTSRNYEIGLRIGRQRGPSTKDQAQAKISEISLLADKMNFEVQQLNGQRFFGPPINFRLNLSKECEVFIGSIPNNIFEDRLVPLLCLAGKLYQLRLMMDFNGFNRGFGFAMFTAPEEAAEACRLLNLYQIAPNRHIVVIPCQDNDALFIGGIRHLSADEIIKRIFFHTPTAAEISVTYPDIVHKRYAIIRFNSHREAALARRYYLVTNYAIWQSKSKVIVDWKSRHNVEQEIHMVGVKDGDNVTLNFVQPNLQA